MCFDTIRSPLRKVDQVVQCARRYATRLFLLPNRSLAFLTDIEICRAETGAQKSPVQDLKSGNRRPETPAHQPNPPECRRFPQHPEITTQRPNWLAGHMRFELGNPSGTNSI